jgi:hypothetical protein
MPSYYVNVTVSMAGWIQIEADSKEEAIEEAMSRAPGDFECDTGTAEVEFNVTPEAELVE